MRTAVARSVVSARIRADFASSDRVRKSNHRAGHGVALAPRMCAAHREPGLTVRVPRAQQPSRQVSLFARRAGDRATHLRTVTDALRTTATELEQSFSSA